MLFTWFGAAVGRSDLNGAPFSCYKETAVVVKGVAVQRTAKTFERKSTNVDQQHRKEARKIGPNQPAATGNTQRTLLQRVEIWKARQHPTASEAPRNPPRSRTEMLHSTQPPAACVYRPTSASLCTTTQPPAKRPSTPQWQPVLYSPAGIVLSLIQETILANLEYFYLGIPSCRALVATAPGNRERQQTLSEVANSSRHQLPLLLLSLTLLSV